MIAERGDERLGERGAFMVDLVARLRAVNLDLLRLLFPNESPDALRMLLSRLVSAGWLRKHPMGNREHYYALGSRALRNVAAPGGRQHRIWHGFGPEGLIQHLGIAFLCARHGLIRLL